MTSAIHNYLPRMATFICASENRLPVELTATEKQSRVIVVSSFFIAKIYPNTIIKIIITKIPKKLYAITDPM